jgi:hypothetical protein
MLVMISNQTGFEAGLLCGMHPGRVGHLFSPNGQRGLWIGVPYGLDCGTFAIWIRLMRGEPVEWDEAEWRALLRWAVLSGIPPLWAVVPDVVANRPATLDWWHRYSPIVRQHGFRPAFVVQNGMTFADVPSSDCALFIGGDDTFKDASIKPWSAAFPGRVHVGRVNGMPRLLACYRAGVESVDGTGWFHKTGNQANDLRRFLRETSNDQISAVA